MGDLSVSGKAIELGILVLIAIAAIAGCRDRSGVRKLGENSTMGEPNTVGLPMPSGVGEKSALKWRENGLAPWECYKLTSTEGLRAVKSWIQRNKKLLEYDLPIISVRPRKRLFVIEDGKTYYYELWPEVPVFPKDPAIRVPKGEEKWIEHIPKAELQKLKDIFIQHGEVEILSPAEGPCPPAW